MERRNFASPDSNNQSQRPAEDLPGTSRLMQQCVSPMRKQREKRDLHCDLHRENSGTCIDKAKHFYARLQNPTRADKIERLSRVRRLCRDVGYGVFDEMTMLIEESGLGSDQ